MVEILAALGAVMKWNRSNLEYRDRLILSKGHGALALYCFLEQKAILSRKETDTFESNGTSFYAHAKRDINKGIDFSGGSLSLGMSFSVGIALACKSKGIENNVFTIIGDGECNEGLIWESLMAAAQYRLNNLKVIVDHNGLQSDGFITEIMNPSNLADKFSAFGFETHTVDGHNVESLIEILSKTTERPMAIIAETTKGKGISFCENNPKWHHGILSKEMFEKAIEELDELQ